MISVRIPKADITALKRQLKKTEQQSTKETKKWVQGAGLVAESRASETAPFKTGTLKKSIRKISEAAGLHARVGSKLQYAVYQNDGTRYIKGKRFMEKGYAAAQQYLARKIKG